ncbi:Homeobox protein Hox-B1b [Thelohanellus kitauei]|uniref:Homeobox protein Hox-B1b n=1 Tax=Thelohanellus kitauei TaxID=669202 RepID=A0A0C2N5P1_THEKT|nr:Homeobox protein Hox-B1b [Thelohanellus kitauei]
MKQRNYGDYYQAAEMDLTNPISYNIQEKQIIFDPNITSWYNDQSYTTTQTLMVQYVLVNPTQDFLSSQGWYDTFSNLYNGYADYNILTQGGEINIPIGNIENAYSDYLNPSSLEPRLPQPGTNSSIQECSQRRIAGIDVLKVEQIPKKSQTAARNTAKDENYMFRTRLLYTQKQLEALEMEFTININIDRQRREDLARDLRLTEKQVKNWFHNRKRRIRTKQRIMIHESRRIDL